MEQTAYIALGSNLGDRAQNLLASLHRLSEVAGVHMRRVSSFLDNPAVGGPADSPPFLNAVAEVRTSLSPQELLKAMLRIELELGRVRSVHWGPRTIDLDLLLYGSQVLHEAELELPHPRMTQREFVMRPLAEIAPEVIHPVLGLCMRDLLARLR